MKRILCTVSYDGTAYSGWQKQDNGIAIEEVINKAVSSLLSCDTSIIGASRTDRGVHAQGNVFVFDTQLDINPEKYFYALNQKLPLDIRLTSSYEVPFDFHPRKCEAEKFYEYHILNQKISDPLRRFYSYFVYYDLDVEAMKEGAAYLVGERDFKAFVNPKSQVIVNGGSTVRNIFSIDVTKDNSNMITLAFHGNGFLYHQIRIMVGTLVKVGLHAYKPELVKEILDSLDRQKAGPTAPAEGLCLKKIIYKSL